MASKYDEAIDKGMKLLDRKAPDWCHKMQLDHLKLASPISCVLGQVYGYYYDGLRELRLRPSQAKDYGFITQPPMNNLTRRWKQRIRERCGAE